MRKPKSQSLLLLPLLPSEKNPRTLLPSGKKNKNLRQPKKQQKYKYKHKQEIKAKTIRSKRLTTNPTTNPRTSEPRRWTQATKPTNSGSEPTNLGGEPTTQGRNPRTQAWIEPMNVYDFLRRRLFSLYSLFFICVEQEIKSLILEFHWKSSPTPSSSTRNRFL